MTKLEEEVKRAISSGRLDIHGLARKTGHEPFEVVMIIDDMVDRGSIWE
jgi:hypothetical protein